MNLFKKTVDFEIPFFISKSDKYRMKNLIDLYFELDSIENTNKNKLHCYRQINTKIDKPVINISKKSPNRIQIGKGSFGTVFKTELKDIKLGNKNLNIATKVYFVRKTDENKPVTYNNSSYKEVITMMMTNKFIDKNITPHVPYLFNWSFCTNCQNLMEPKIKTIYTGCVTLFMELAYGDFADFMSKELLNKKSNILSNRIYQSIVTNYPDHDITSLITLIILFQLMSGLNALQLEYSLYHRDIKPQNMLIYKIPYKENEFIKYTINDVDYFIPNIGIIASISDLGLCNTQSSEVQNTVLSRDLGDRLGMVINNSGEYKFEPFELNKNINITNRREFNEISNNCTLFYKNFKGLPEVHKLLSDNWKHGDNHYHYGFDIYNLITNYPKNITLTKPEKILTPNSVYIEKVSFGTVFKFTENDVKLTDQQKQEIARFNDNSTIKQSSNPQDISFFDNIKLFPSTYNMMDTQDVLRSFCGGPRTFYGQPLYSISRKIQYNYSSSLGRTLLLLNDIGKYITLGPDSDYITQNFTNESATISERFKNTYNTDDIWFDYFINQHPKIITDNPSTMLAHYFINDFENFHIFYNQPTGANILQSYQQN